MMERVTTPPIKLHHPFLGCRRGCCHRSLNTSALKKSRWQVRAESVAPVVRDIHPGHLKITTGYENSLSLLFFGCLYFVTHPDRCHPLTTSSASNVPDVSCPPPEGDTHLCHIPAEHGQKRAGEGTCKKITCLNFPDGIPPRKQSSIIHNRHS